MRSDADANFEGRITDYSIRPSAIQGNERAGLERLTISISVKYTNVLKPELNFEKSFSRFKDFSTQSKPLQAQEQQLIKDINVKYYTSMYNVIYYTSIYFNSFELYIGFIILFLFLSTLLIL